MRALTMDEVGFVSGGLNPYSNPTDPSSWDPEAKTPAQKAFEAAVRMDAKHAVEDQMAADLAGLLGAELAAKAAGFFVGTLLGDHPGAGIALGEATGSAAKGPITQGALKAIQHVRAFYIDMYFKILDRYGIPR